jgi:MshEN domain
MNDAVIDQSNDSGTRTALGTLLIERGLIDVQQLDDALRIGADTGERLGEVLVREGWTSEEDLAKTLAEQWHLRYLERSAISFDGNALSRLSHEEATRLEALPMQFNDEGAIVVALAEPTDARLLALRSLLGDRIDCVVVAKSAIDAGLRSDLLVKNETATNVVGITEVAAPTQAEPDQPVEQQETTGLWNASPVAATADEGEPKSSDFDEFAKTLSDGLSSQLASLRAIVVEAESTRERDSLEIARLTTELSDRATELTSRTETLKSMQQTLRELADKLDQSL